MSSRLVVTGLAAVFVVALVLVSPSADGCAALAQAPPGQGRLGAAPPGTHGVPGTPPILRPEEIEKRISPDEREKLGLPEPTWVAQYGKVHPDVRTILETGQMPWVKFKGWEPIGFEGMAYVAVHLRIDEGLASNTREREAAIKQVQGRVLSRLTAAEFATVLPFKNSPGIVGYVNPGGLAKLARDPDVIGVSLDERPVPERPDPVTAADLAAADRNQPSAQAAKDRAPERVAPDVHRALALHERVFVLVSVGGRSVDEWAEKQIGEARAVEESLLRCLSADDFWVCGRTPITSRHSIFLQGEVSRAGLEKLAAQPSVTGVCLNGPPIVFPDVHKNAR